MSSVSQYCNPQTLARPGVPCTFLAEQSKITVLQNLMLEQHGKKKNELADFERAVAALLSHCDAQSREAVVVFQKQKKHTFRWTCWQYQTVLWCLSLLLAYRRRITCWKPPFAATVQPAARMST